MAKVHLVVEDRVVEGRGFVACYLESENPGAQTPAAQLASELLNYVQVAAKLSTSLMPEDENEEGYHKCA